jgi:TetR/AcrR family transcriptional regulator, mexJK operon transcriptional repressor
VADPRRELLEPGLRRFGLDITSSAVTSSDYAVLHRLLVAGPAELLSGSLDLEKPERMLVGYLKEFHAAGLVDVPDADVAADHFIALTVLLAINKADRRYSRGGLDVRRVVADGTRAFLRAYGASPATTGGAATSAR